MEFLTVAEQVAVLFVLIAAGFVCGKKGIITEQGSKVMTDIVLFLATPCVIIQSFQREYNAELLYNLLIALLCSALIHIGTIGIAHLLLRDARQDRERVLRFALVFSNAGYMALPLQQALLGSEGVFFGSMYVVVFNLTVWSYGLAMMSGGVKSLSPKKLLINPGVIGLVVGFSLFLLRITLPDIIAAPIAHMANLNTPLPMLIIGCYLATIDLSTVLRDKKAIATVLLRLIAVPLFALGLMYLCGVRDTVLVSCVIGASAPVAAATTMFATRYNADIPLSVNLVSLSTLLSVITMPLIVSLANYLA